MVRRDGSSRRCDDGLLRFCYRHCKSLSHEHRVGVFRRGSPRPGPSPPSDPQAIGSTRPPARASAAIPLTRSSAWCSGDHVFRSERTTGAGSLRLDEAPKMDPHGKGTRQTSIHSPAPRPRPRESFSMGIQGPVLRLLMELAGAWRSLYTSARRGGPAALWRIAGEFPKPAVCRRRTIGRLERRHLRSTRHAIGAVVWATVSTR